MKPLICPECGCGKLIESTVYGLECDNCGEVFEIGDAGEPEVVDYYKWKECFDLFNGKYREGKCKKVKK